MKLSFQAIAVVCGGSIESYRKHFLLSTGVKAANQSTSYGCRGIWRYLSGRLNEDVYDGLVVGGEKVVDQLELSY